MDLMMVVDDGSEVVTSYYFGIKLRYGLMGSSQGFQQVQHDE